MTHPCQHAEIGDEFIAETSTGAEGYRSTLKRYGFLPTTAQLPDGRFRVVAAKLVPLPDNPALRDVIKAAAKLPKGKTHIFEHDHSPEAHLVREKMMRVIRRESRGAKFQIRLRDRHTRSTRARFALIRTA